MTARKIYSCGHGFNHLMKLNFLKFKKYKNTQVVPFAFFERNIQDKIIS